jgi:F420-dependent oxidoreductase-like protein
MINRSQMQFGLQHPNFNFDFLEDSSLIIDSLKNLVIKAENAGFDSFWVMDHLQQLQIIGSPQDPLLEGWTTLSTLAGLTSKIKLGTLVTGVIYRHPSVLAKIGATLDVLSKGRLFMGIGAAWNEQESIAYGITSPFPSYQERLNRLEEAVQIIRKMWTKEPTCSFNGKYYQIRNAYCNPKPIQKPAPPILIGGGGEKRTLKIVAKYADACNLIGSVETINRKLTALREHCKTVGRDYDSVLKTKLCTVIINDDPDEAKNRVQEILNGIPEEQIREFAIYGTPEEVYRQIDLFRTVGIDYVIVNLDPTNEIESLEKFEKKILQKFK